jgi:hypothetical protein
VETSNEIREMPGKIVREAGIEKDLEDFRKSTHSTLNELERTHLPNISPVATPPQVKSKIENPGQNEEKDSD